MELELFRQDLIQSSTCSTGTLAVLPLAEEKKTQKVAVGDLNGVIQAFSVKRGEFQYAFKTMPGPKVTSLTLGRARAQRDRIFVASGSTVKGISKKGKEFFKFFTQVTETIGKVDIYDKNIWCSGEYVHNHFMEAKDEGLFLSPDRINDAEIMPLDKPLDKLEEMCVVLACQDRFIRVLQNSALLYEVPTPAAATAIKHVADSHDPQGRFPHARELLYGTDVGGLQQLMLEPTLQRPGFSLANTKKLGSIRAIYSGIDFTKTGLSNVVLGREDGVLEVYELEEAGQLRQVFSVKLSESINCLEGGYVTSLSAQELVLHTFSGKVISYAPPGGGMMVGGAPEAPPPPPTGAMGLLLGRGRPPPPEATRALSEDELRKATYAAQVARLRTEIDGVKAEIEAEQARFIQTGGNTAQLAMSAPFSVQDRLKLEADEACYQLLIESAVPIFTVALQCNVSLQLLDVPSNVAIISRSPADEANGNLTLATYRCQDSTSRLAIKFKVREGRTAALTALIIPAITPKVCVSVQHTIRPLCLHTRVAEVDAKRPMIDLTFTGSFSVGDMHAWVSSLLPDIPPQLPPGQSAASYTFINTLLGTQLVARYSSSEAHFSSDFISTLGIVQGHIMREATAAKARVESAFGPSAASLAHGVSLVWPKLQAQRELQKLYHQLEGLQELKMQDGDVSYLSPHHRSVLERADKIRVEYRESPQHLDHLVALIKDLYVDYAKLTGVSGPKSRLPALEHLLMQSSSTLRQVMDFLTGI